MKEVKRLSDEVLLYKSWGESPSGHEAPGEWLRVAMPSLGYSTKPWVIALRNLSGFSTAL